jgi:glycosyltransferase involved in cell wall biosynthesis
MYDFAKGLKEIGNDVFVVLPYHKNLNKNHFSDINIRPFKYFPFESFHVLGYGRTLLNDQRLKWFVYLLAPFFFFFGCLKIYQTVKKEKIDVINSHWLLPNGFMAAVVSKFTGVPLVITLPGSDVYLSKQNILFSFMAQIAIKQSKLITSNSGLLLKDLGVKGKVISYGVPVNTGFRIKNKKIVIASAGRRVEKKGFEKLTEQVPEIEIISGLPLQQFHKKLLGVDIFIFLSGRDSKSNLDDASLVVLEAMAAGCAVIVSDLPGNRKIIKNGINGFLVKPEKISVWKKLISDMRKSKSKRDTLGKNARKTIRKSFTPKRIALEYLKLFKSL